MSSYDTPKVIRPGVQRADDFDDLAARDSPFAQDLPRFDAILARHPLGAMWVRTVHAATNISTVAWLATHHGASARRHPRSQWVTVSFCRARSVISLYRLVTWVQIARKSGCRSQRYRTHSV